MLRRFLFSLLVCVLPALPALAHKPVLRALVACDMLSQNIEGGTTADAIRMRKTISTIARLLGIHSKTTTFRKGEMTAPRIQKWISSLPRNSKDIVLFYYSGHGGRGGGRLGKVQGRWPIIILPKKNPDKSPGLLMGKTIYQQINRKKPRLAIVLFNSCNSQRCMKERLELPSTFPEVDETELPQLRKLFLRTRGTVIASAAVPGEKAFEVVQGPFAGGLFTTSLFYSLKYYALGSDVTWKTVFFGTGLFCQRFSHGKQHPQYSIKLR